MDATTKPLILTELGLTSESSVARLLPPPLWLIVADYAAENVRWIALRSRCMRATRKWLAQPTANLPNTGSSCIKRVLKELKTMLDPDRFPFLCVAPNTADVMKWHGACLGPLGTPYANGIFEYSVEFSSDYPFKPPRVLWLTKTYHCGLPDGRHTGDMGCLDILKDNWSPAITAPQAMVSQWTLLADPNPDSPLAPAIAKQYKLERAEHDRIAKQWTELYASIGPGLSGKVE